ncbi:MAG TPA: hypothetical protein VK629_14515 [Steroidobacteraceae bacterium]|nr:hypothetical protein [Steroidobacteraceae bacterium]
MHTRIKSFNAVAAMLSLLTIAAPGLAFAADAKWKAPRTPWGAPDLQGTWTNGSLTSLERDDAFKGKASMTQAEADEFERTNAFAQMSKEDAIVLMSQFAGVDKLPSPMHIKSQG